MSVSPTKKTKDASARTGDLFSLSRRRVLIPVSERSKDLKWYHANKEKISRRNAARYQKNKEKLKEVNRLKYLKSRERILEIKRRHRELHRDEYNAKARAKRRMFGNRWDYLKRRFGITKAQYDGMLLAQKGTCAICGQFEKKNRRLSVDHCHKTGKVRGLLCLVCNSALGKFRDDIQTLVKAQEYLKRYESDTKNIKTT